LKKIKAELLKKPEVLLEYTLKLESELIRLRKNYDKALRYMPIALRRADPNKLKQNLKDDFYRLYKDHFKNKTHQKATESILQDKLWHMLCKLDPALSRLKTPKAFKEKFNSIKKVKTEKS
tara:strand:+ start:44 stop:406 length:363 start_codon:yes stop_codon:yes gene_type:complete